MTAFPPMGLTVEGAQVSTGHKTNGQNILGTALMAPHALLAQEASDRFALAAQTPKAAQTKQASWVSPQVSPHLLFLLAPVTPVPGTWSSTPGPAPRA